MRQPANADYVEHPASDRGTARFMLATVAGTAAVMTGVVLAGSGAMTIDGISLSRSIVATAGLALVVGLIALRKRLAALPATIDRQSAQHALAFAGVAAALLLSFVFVNRVTDALSTTSETVNQTASTHSTQASAPRTSASTHAYQTDSTAKKSAHLLSCERDSESAPVTTIDVGATRDV